MPQEFKAINLGGVNCFLLKAVDGFLLVDCGISNQRTALEKALAQAGCKPGSLKLVVLTHGDVDHAGNAAFLREKYGAKIAIHRDDSGMVETGDMGWNRKAKPDRIAFPMNIITKIAAWFPSKGRLDTFTPDFHLEDGMDLAAYGFDARVLHLPGHSKGSTGVLTSGGDLFCGDLLYNFSKPGPSFIDDLEAANASLKKLGSYQIRMVYPGHGKPFPAEKMPSRI